MKKDKSYCFIGGHSGGHIIPSNTLAYNIKKKYPSAHILFFTTTDLLDQRLTTSFKKMYTVIPLPVRSFSGKNPCVYIYHFILLIYSFFISCYHLTRHRPESITSSGGIITIPISCAAYILRIPIDLYELNVLPGKATQFLAPIARTIYCSFERTQTYLPKNKVLYSAYPIRFFDKEQCSQEHARSLLNIPHYKKVIFIVGGSQGSLFINNAIKQWLEQENDYQSLYIIHQTGSHDKTNWQSYYFNIGIDAVSFTFNNNMEHYYISADLVICRSGAGSLFEVLYFNKKCITIPLVTPNNNHQLHNAFTIAHSHPELFTVVTQEEITQYPLKLNYTIQENIQMKAQSKNKSKIMNPPSTS